MLPPFTPRVNLSLFALPAVLAAASLSLSVAGEWPMFRGADQSGISKEGGLRESGKAPVAWTAEVGLGYSAPVVGGGRVIVTGHDGNETDTIYCFDEATGELKWKRDYPQPLGDLYFQGGTTGAATIDGNRVYHIAREGEVVCLAASDGRIIWQRHLQDDFGYSKPTWGFTGAPLVRGDHVYLTAGESGLALEKSDGSEIWKSKNEEAGYSTPFALSRNGTDYLIFSNKRAYVCVKEETGETAWQERWMTRYGVNAADPVISGDYIFLSSGYGKGAVLLEWKDGEKPQKLWQNREMRTQMNAAVLIGEHLYGIDGNESVDGTGIKCLDLANGNTVWTDTAVGHGTLSAVNDRLLVLTESGTLQVAPASPGGYEPTFSQAVVSPRVWTVPVYANGRVYCRNDSGQFVVLLMKTEQ